MTPGGTRALAAFAAGVVLVAGALLAVIVGDDRPARAVADSTVIHSPPGEPPHLSDERLRHIIARHWPDSSARHASKFTAPMSAARLVSFIREADAGGKSRPNTGGRPGRLLEYDLGRNIGTTIGSDGTSRIRIVVSDNNQVITAFPF